MASKISSMMSGNGTKIAIGVVIVVVLLVVAYLVYANWPAVKGWYEKMWGASATAPVTSSYKTGGASAKLSSHQYVAPPVGYRPSDTAAAKLRQAL